MKSNRLSTNNNKNNLLDPNITKKSTHKRQKDIENPPKDIKKKKLSKAEKMRGIRLYNELVPLNERRLDSLARLIQGKSICAAVCFHNDQLFVATNTIHDGTNFNKNQEVDLVNSVMNYFINLANNIKNEQERIDLCTAICKAKISAELYITEPGDIQGLVKKALSLKRIKELIEVKLSDINPNAISKNRSTNLAIINAVYSVLRDFKKFESYVSGVKLSENEIARKKLIAVLKNSSWLFVKGKKNVHAEMRLIQYFFNSDLYTQEKLIDILGSTEIYLGISLLSCYSCTSALSAVNDSSYLRHNDKLSNNIVKFAYRGSHGLDFADNWGEPEFLIANQSIKDALLKIKNLNNLGAANMQENVMMQADESDSEAEGLVAPKSTPTKLPNSPVKTTPEQKALITKIKDEILITEVVKRKLDFDPATDLNYLEQIFKMRLVQEAYKQLLACEQLKSTVAVLPGQITTSSDAIGELTSFTKTHEAQLKLLKINGREETVYDIFCREQKIAIQTIGESTRSKLQIN